MQQVDKQKNYELAEALLAEQNFAAALIVGAIAMLLAATAYGLTTVVWPFSYGFAAAGIGIVIGFSMQYLGRGIQMRFAVAAALYTIAACVLGNVIRAILSAGRSPLHVIGSDDFAEYVQTGLAYVSFVDLVFWFVAIWFAIFLARRPLSREEITAISLYELKA
ncbi:hypothetical protein [Woeseia oceani]|uniref:Uncharacterized protein n=1 Tax=Woeseia oceani TaxID=1548547 RepID=A0A193LHX7_9GAMM|nr:hypothetical protein [Woeseia oceani]ANO52043.1 hypothetical protein BA177_13285 [Woeseia oceani]